MTISYDKRADVLYISFVAIPPESYTVVENQAGDVLKLDRHTNQVVGCTLPYFLARSAKGKVQIPEIGPVPFNDIAADLVAHQ